MIFGYQLVLKLNSSGTVQNCFFWGVNQDELIAENDQFTLCDHLGSVRDVINASGTSLNHLEYNAFGKLINRSSTSNVPTFRYTAKMTDDTTELQWNINRWYDPNTGKWISQDPIGFEAGDVNLYRYVGNRMATHVDILGQWDKKIHYEKTLTWTTDIGYRFAAAKRIAEFDEAVDSYLTVSLSPSYLPIPLGGYQAYHFNRNLDIPGDSRKDLAKWHYGVAVAYCIAKEIVNPETAARHLGIALHPLQDFFAHGDYGIIDKNPNGGIWITHNKYGSELAGAAGEPWQYPDDPTLDAIDGPDGRPAGKAIKTKKAYGFTVDYALYKKGTTRIKNTEAMTKDILGGFRDMLIEDAELCKCREYFIAPWFLKGL